jgi:hypothetical protein
MPWCTRRCHCVHKRGNVDCNQLFLFHHESKMRFLLGTNVRCLYQLPAALLRRCALLYFWPSWWIVDDALHYLSARWDLTNTSFSLHGVTVCQQIASKIYLKSPMCNDMRWTRLQKQHVVVATAIARNDYWCLPLCCCASDQQSDFHFSIRSLNSVRPPSDGQKNYTLLFRPILNFESL